MGAYLPNHVGYLVTTFVKAKFEHNLDSTSRHVLIFVMASPRLPCTKYRQFLLSPKIILRNRLEIARWPSASVIIPAQYY